MNFKEYLIESTSWVTDFWNKEMKDSENYNKKRDSYAKRTRAKQLGLTHQSHSKWIDQKGIYYKWNEKLSRFEKDVLSEKEMDKEFKNYKEKQQDKSIEDILSKEE
jgi:hypothetical protein